MTPTLSPPWEWSGLYRKIKTPVRKRFGWLWCWLFGHQTDSDTFYRGGVNVIAYRIRWCWRCHASNKPKLYQEVREGRLHSK